MKDGWGIGIRDGHGLGKEGWSFKLSEGWYGKEAWDL